MVRKCCLCFSVFINVLLINTVTSVETYYKLVGTNDDEAMNDENKPFLTQSFFVCGSKENCKKIAKTIESSEFKEVIGQQKLKEDSVAYEKMETPKAKVPTWSEWKVEKCSAKCRGGSRTLMRYCYNHLPCVGEGSKAEKCNTEGCPDLQNCTQNTTVFTPGDDSSRGHRTWYPLLNHSPSCYSSEGTTIMTGVKLEISGTGMRYNFTCCFFKDPVCHATSSSTPWNDFGTGNAHFLDRHIIECGAFGFISSFQLENINSKIRYTYMCCAIFNTKWKNSMQCFDRHTSYVGDNTHSIYTLAQIPVQCKTGFGLSSLSLQREISQAHWRFKFRCCKVIH